MAETDSEKTEEATPERRRKAREEGQFPRARDSGATLGSFAVMLTLAGLSETSVDTLRAFCMRCFGEPYALTRGSFEAVLYSVASVFALLALPAALAASVGASAAGLAEAGYHPNLSLAAPKWSRLAPLGKLKNMFSPKDASINLALQVGRVLAVAVVAYWSVKKAFPVLVRLARTGLSSAASEIAVAVFQLAVWASLALVALVMLDYFNSYRKHEEQIRMSRQEVKEEIKQQEGDPRIRSRQRAKAREMLKRGLAQAVKESDFVIANPTHVSVAIRYRLEEGAPVLTAKGYDEVALYIRKLAEESDVPIVENIALARALAGKVRVGRAIPVDFYAPVAEVLAFVYRLRRKLKGIPMA